MTSSALSPASRTQKSPAWQDCSKAPGSYARICFRDVQRTPILFNFVKYGVYRHPHPYLRRRIRRLRGRSHRPRARCRSERHAPGRHRFARTGQDAHADGKASRNSPAHARAVPRLRPRGLEGRDRRA